MAALSATHTTTTTLTPPSSSHGNQSWNYSSSGHNENPTQDKSSAFGNDITNRGLFATPNGNSSGPFDPTVDASARKMAFPDNAIVAKGNKPIEASYVTPTEGNDLSVNSGGIGAPESPLDPYGSQKLAAGPDRKQGTGAPKGISDDESSKWIHRDKLARIENEELQAAGIILPRVRAPSRPRREHRSQEMLNGAKKSPDAPEQTTVRSRKNSAATEHRPTDITVPSWDLRLPDEIAAEGNDGYWTAGGSIKGTTRIPVAKLSPVPIPVDYLERESPSVRKHLSDSMGEDAIAYPKTRSRSASMKALDSSPSLAVQPAKRSATDLSPKKGTATAARKTSAPARTAPPGARPKTRGGPNKDSSSSNGTRPSTRSGELSPSNSTSKQPEGEPPWMISAYQPDPRLPPEKQLLPTVARRLQQEKWEKEGKFGNIYDREFRPLTDEGFLKPPEARTSVPRAAEEKQLPEEWPLKTEPVPRSPQYSTMPRIQDKPHTSPLPSPRAPSRQQQYQIQREQLPLSPQDILSVQEQPDEQPPKKGCGCCIVM